MILAETIFCDGAPVGTLLQDSYSGQVGFSPLKGKSLLPQKRWRDINDLKLAVIEAYAHKEGGTSE